MRFSQNLINLNEMSLVVQKNMFFVFRTHFTASMFYPYKILLQWFLNYFVTLQDDAMGAKINDNTITAITCQHGPRLTITIQFAY